MSDAIALAKAEISKIVGDRYLIDDDSEKEKERLGWRLGGLMRCLSVDCISFDVDATASALNEISLRNPNLSQRLRGVESKTRKNY